MTRLREQDIAELGNTLSLYNNSLVNMLGTGLAGIAAHSIAKTPAVFDKALQGSVVGIIPLSYGEGIIPGFSQAVRHIVEFLGATAFVTRETNLKGMAEAVERGATLLFLSDDNDFFAINITTGKTAENGEATGRGFGAALDLAAIGVNGHNVLIIGAGPVGRAASRFLFTRGGQIYIHDRDADQARKACHEIGGGKVVTNLREALQLCKYVVEATPSPGVIKKRFLSPATWIAAPGVPIGIDNDDPDVFHGKIIHDVLEIGVATMLYTALDGQ